MNRRCPEKRRSLMKTMRRAVVRSLLVIVALLSCAVAVGSEAPAPEEKLPTGEEILERAIEVSGGKEAIAKIRNRMVEGTMEVKGMGLKGPLVAYQARPNKTYTKIEIEGVGTIEQGTDGDVAWEVNALTGPRVKEGGERALLLLLSHFDETTFAERLEKIECTGVEEVQGETCYKVVATAKDKEAPPITTYYSKESGLTVKLSLTFPHQMGKIAVENLLGDYKEVDGLLLPHHTVEKAMHIETHITMSGCKHNVELPDDRFDLPDVIKALIERAKKDEAKKSDDQKSDPDKAAQADPAPTEK